MTGIVFEGGTFRPIFSCGVMDALLSENILLPYCIGVSAGIADGVSYISKQPQRNLEIMQKYRNDKRYMSRSNWKKYKSIFGLDFVFGEIPDHLIPFDWDTFRSYEGTCLVGVTNAKTGQIEYKNAPLDVVDGNQRQACGIAEALHAVDACQQRADQPGAEGDGKRVDVGKIHACLAKRLVDNAVARVNMRAAGDFRHHAAVEGMGVHL